jgi:hypothetical protein
VYIAQSLFHSNFGRLVRNGLKTERAAGGVALCMRFRDEAPFLAEWIEYYLAAGVDHFFLYNNYSVDDYGAVLDEFMASGRVTLIDWPRTPASPAAEEDCIERAMGRFEWVGFLDADEFVVVRDGRSIADFLTDYAEYPGVALNWRYFGSNGHKQRPAQSVITAYTRAAANDNFHVKCFVRPEAIAQCRNSHSWYFRGMRTAVNEQREPVYGSISAPPSTQLAWINHYYAKSAEDYLTKALRKSTQDEMGIKYPTRTVEALQFQMTQKNDREDRSAIEYYEARCAATGRVPSASVKAGVAASSR